MKRFSLGVIVGLLIGVFLATATIVAAAPNAIKLIINGQEICPDIPPQIIDGRVMVPARFVAEPLGAQVEWDAASNTIYIISQSKEVNIMAPESQSASEQEPVPDHWCTLREAVELKGWAIDPNGRVWANGNIAELNAGITELLFNYNDLSDLEVRTINGRVYLSPIVLDRF